MIKFEKLIEVLDRHQVQYVIIGGLAAVIHGASYITNDLDICYERTEQNYINLVKALTPFNPQLRGPEEPLPFIFDIKTLKNGMNFTLKTDLGFIDLLGEIAGAGTYKIIKTHAEQTELFKKTCFVISLADLILAKKAAGRKKDLLILDELEAIQEIKSKK